MFPTLRKALQMLAVLVAFGIGAAQAQEYPTKPVRIVVPYPAGGFNDTLGRLAAKHLGDYWKKPVIVDNKPGAGTMIGTREVAGAAPDGHTILVVQFPYAANPWLYKNIAYDTQKAFTPVMLAGRSPMLLVTHAQSPYRTAAEFLAAARAKPNVLTYGSSGAGSSNHLAMALFENATGTQMRQIPYKGSTPMLTDLAGGQFDVALDLLPHAMPFMQIGPRAPTRHRGAAALAPAARRAHGRGSRNPRLRGLVLAWLRGAVRHPAVGRRQAQQATSTGCCIEDEVKKAFAAQGVAPDGGTPAHFRSFIDGQMALWKKVVTDRSITVD
jgi:tripartite-type tricarboxylate transporter receptor subunit TctC